MSTQKIKVHYTFDELTDRGWVTRSRTFNRPMEVYGPDEVIEVARTDEETWLRLPDGRTAATSWGRRPLADGRLDLHSVHLDGDTDGRAQVEANLAGLVVVDGRLLSPEPLPWVSLTADLCLETTQAPDDGQASLNPAGLVAPLAQMWAVKNVIRASEEADEEELARWTCTEHEDASFDIHDVAAYLRQVRAVIGAADALRRAPSWETMEALRTQLDLLTQVQKQRFE